MSQKEWLEYLSNDVAYIKPVVENGQNAFSIHAGDGTPLAVIGDKNTAIAAVQAHDMKPMSVH